MQTERVTFLTSRDHKAALDAYASKSGKSVGHVLREASARYIEQDQAAEDEYEEALEQILPEIEALLPKWHAQMDAMERSIEEARKAIREAIASVGARR